MPQRRLLMGDRIGRALQKIGITDERVSNFIGRPCNCSKRRDYLNSLDLWARRVISGKSRDARNELDDLLEGLQEDPNPTTEEDSQKEKKGLHSEREVPAIPRK